MERFVDKLSHKFSRRGLLKAAVISAGAISLIYTGLDFILEQEEQKAFRDPYRGIHLDGYLEGYISIDLRGVDIRTAPKLDPNFLRIYNPEAFIKGEVPPGFMEVGVSNREPDQKSILGDLVEVNHVSVVEDRYDLFTDRKSILINPVIIQNPGVVRGEDPNNPDSQEGQWIVLNTLLRIPDEKHTDYPNKVVYTVTRRTYYLNLDTQEYSTPSTKDLLVPLTTHSDGSHIRMGDGQPVRGLGRVIVSQPG